MQNSGIQDEMKNKAGYLLTGVSLGIALMVFVFAVIPDNSSVDEAYHKLFRKYTRVFVPEVPSKVTFAGEEVPMNLYYVRESMEREVMAGTFMHSSTLQMFKRAYRWFPVIEPILRKNGIPDDFKFLAVAESNLGNVTSPAGAEGPWQFLKATGQKYGLEINSDIDERYNMEKATQAAGEYFKDGWKEYKNWTLVAAAYNRGPDGISKALEKQKVSSYYDLYLNEETARYLFRIIAIKQIYNQPVKYGFYTIEQDFYPQVPVKLVTIDSTVKDLPALALALKTNYRVLRELNPWIQSYLLPNKSGKIYTLKVPREPGALQYENLLKKVPQRETFFHDTLKINSMN